MTMQLRAALATGFLMLCVSPFSSGSGAAWGLGVPVQAAEEGQDRAQLVIEAQGALLRGTRFFRTISTQGGYVYSYSVDLSERWGENKVEKSVIEVQAPGTPAVGSAYLRAFQVTGDTAYLEAAVEAGGALIKGQNRLGGWGHTIDFAKPFPDLVSFDDNQSQGAIRFLMALDQEVDQEDLGEAIGRALRMMIDSQQEHGGWPHQYPHQGNYHDYATFNDGGINDCIAVLLEAHTRYAKPELLASLRKAARFLIVSQIAPPQPGWAQQYDEFLHPAWARAFEPPSVCPSVTLRNVHSLMDLYLHIGDRTYLEPIPDALAWVESVRMENGKWPRFAELGTNRPLYYDRGRIRVNSVEELSLERRTGYSYEVDLSGALASAQERFARVLTYSASRRAGSAAIGAADTLPRLLEREGPPTPLPELAERVREIIDAQDAQGRWISRNDRFRNVDPGEPWNGKYRTLDRISSRVFCRNVLLLCEYLERVK